MTSILQEILKLRSENNLDIDYNNTNRYRVVINEKDTSKTAYYFSAPIYNSKTRAVVDLNFNQKENIAYATGTNTNITIGTEIHLENAEGCCILNHNKPVELFSEHTLHCGDDIIKMTTNGIAYMAKYKSSSLLEFDIEVDKPYLGTRYNDKYFSFMSDKYRPFATIAVIGTMNSAKELVAPAQISSQKIHDKKYKISLSPCTPDGEYILFEFNLYEPKLLQDTTVESRNPNTNNAFGSTAFIGYTPQFGEQWLYSRPDYSKLSDLMDKQIKKAILHIPQYNKKSSSIAAFGVKYRFCSFGSNWNNKIEASNTIANTTSNCSYQNLDITGLLADARTGYIKRSEGLILKPTTKESGLSILATGDSYYTPQIFEINYK